MKIIKTISIKWLSLFVRGPLSKVISKISTPYYLNLKIKYLKKCGVNILGNPNFIASDVYFDGHDYSKITLMNGCVISREVLMLTHDFSIARGIEKVKGKSWQGKETPHFLREIQVGENSFVGARAILLPGTRIGKDCIIGAGCVVKGVIPDNSIVVGNPAKIIAKTDEWALSHIEKHDYLP